MFQPIPTASETSAKSAVNGLRFRIDRENDPSSYKVILDEHDLRNSVVFIGNDAGRTAMFDRFVREMLAAKAGVLLFDSYGDRFDRAAEAARGYNRPIVRLGIGHQSVNLIGGLTPHAAATLIDAVIPHPSSADGYAVFPGLMFVESMLELLRLFPERYSLKGLYDAIFTSAGRRDLRIDVAVRIEELKRVAESFQPGVEAFHSGACDVLTQIEQITRCSQYVKYEFSARDTAAQEQTYAALAFLHLFDRAEFTKAFCDTSSAAHSLSGSLDGALISFDPSRIIDGFARGLLYPFIKQVVYQTLLDEDALAARQGSSSTSPVVFACDEYDAFLGMAGGFDAAERRFISRARRNGIIRAIGFSGIDALQSAIGDPAATQLCLNAFLQRMIFRTDDQATSRFFVPYMLGSDFNDIAFRLRHLKPNQAMVSMVVGGNPFDGVTFTS